MLTAESSGDALGGSFWGVGSASACAFFGAKFFFFLFLVPCSPRSTSLGGLGGAPGHFGQGSCAVRVIQSCFREIEYQFGSNKDTDNQPSSYTLSNERPAHSPTPTPSLPPTPLFQCECAESRAKRERLPSLASVLNPARSPRATWNTARPYERRLHTRSPLATSAITRPRHLVMS